MSEGLNSLKDNEALKTLSKGIVSTNETGTSETKKSINLTPVKTEESETLGSDTKNSLKAIKEATSKELNLLDESSECLMNLIREHNEVKMDSDEKAVKKPSWDTAELTINLSRELRETIKTKALILKTVGDILR
jgi:hypothetical protein